MSLMSIPNNDEDDNKPMIIGGVNRDTRKGSVGLRIFKKKPGSTSPRRASNEKKQSNTVQFNPVNKDQTTSLDNTDDKTKDSNIFTKLSKMGRIFKTKTNDVLSKANKDIEAKLKEEQQDKTRSFNMLLLGAGGSGKTTVFKQMDKLYNDIDEKQLEAAKEDIYRNILQDIYDMSKYNIKLNSTATTDEYRLANDETVDICHRISTWPNHFILESARTLLHRELAEEISKLWHDKAMKHTWEKRRNSHIMDNTPYFLDKVLEMVHNPKTNDAPYKCTFNDYVRVRDQTTGIIVKDFYAKTEFGEYKFSVTDVGGQRAERRKWMRLFDNISVVVYIMSLSAYDQCLYEDNTRKCWDETLELFGKTSHEAVFDTTDWVVFFNKVDIFETKILKIPFTEYQPNFNPNDAHNSKKVKEFIRDAFTHRFYEGLTPQRKKKRGSIYFHITCATLEGSVSEIIQKVQIDLIKSQMKKMGYLL
eukprot:14948_1